MNLNSITTKITFVFLLTFSLLIAVFIFYLEFEKKQKNLPIIIKYENYSNFLHEKKFPPHEVIQYFEKLHFKVEENHRNVLSKSMILIQKRGFEAIYYENNYYFHIVTPRFRLLLKDLNSYESTNYSYYLFLVFFILLVLIYIWLIKSLKPLHDLKNQISKFASGDLNIDCSSNKKDEIANVANEFNGAVKEISLLLNSRQLFLRTIMHELKTPIAKGRIVSELIDDNRQKDRLVIIFEKLDFLINDFAKIEQVVSKNYELNRQNFTLDEILNHSIKMLMMDNHTDKINIETNGNKILNVDLDLISMAIKNLIDNALKYSKTGKIVIKEEKDEILFISDGECLPKTLDEYFKPFHNDTQSKNHGMGLGLYIVYSILQLHKIHLKHDYINNQNIFKIIFNEK